MESGEHSQIPKGRQELARVIRHAGDVIKVDDAAQTLQLSTSAAAKKLSRWVEQGWLRRVARGTYVAVTLDTLGESVVLENPFVLVPALFTPAYVGGRSAAEYWDLTEQVFNDVVVITSRPIRQKSQRRHGVLFTLKHVNEKKIFGTKTLWRQATKVLISDIHKTILDILDDPLLGGGAHHVTSCLHAYLIHPDRNDEKFLEYADRLGNGAVFKRLGFLTEQDPSADVLVKECKKRLTKGLAKLDPSIGKGRIVERWRLMIPQGWSLREQL
ncbi:MAG: type IV toxin-antitoxin system AbiEi family antitoxin domain-containing protein [Chlamydiia bacterium]|nr:type IV toxin-antitoxin system AbiEi family antitoxin domain-containing protein [Chlamydiia bacterium]